MTTVLGSLPQFLRYLSGLPDADGMVTALVRGPLAPFGATRATFLELKGDELISVHAMGYSASLVHRFAHFPTNVDLPSTRSLDGPKRSRVENLLEDYPILRLDTAKWRSVIEDNGPGEVIGFPVHEARRTTGVITILTADGPGVRVLPDQLAACLGSIIGLWWSHPLTPKARVNTSPEDDILSLDERQQTILVLVEQGLSTAKIAARLGYSESTVKQQIQRAMQRLRVSNRRQAAARAREMGLL